MNITISEAAVQWYENELFVEDGDEVRFFVRYGGVGGLVPGFSLGIKVEPAENIHASTIVHGITFYVTEDDAWYFDDNNLEVVYDDQLEEPQFNYV